MHMLPLLKHQSAPSCKVIYLKHLDGHDGARDKSNLMEILDLYATLVCHNQFYLHLSYRVGKARVYHDQGRSLG